jgi:hypothetical protein
MAVHEVRASGREYLALVTQHLQRARLTDADAVLWEAADLQWWSRTPRRSDAIDQRCEEGRDGTVRGSSACLVKVVAPADRFDTG